MDIDFPDSPTEGQIWTDPNTKIAWHFTGSVWYPSKSGRSLSIGQFDDVSIGSTATNSGFKWNNSIQKWESVDLPTPVFPDDLNNYVPTKYPFSFTVSQAFYGTTSSTANVYGRGFWETTNFNPDNIAYDSNARNWTIPVTGWWQINLTVKTRVGNQNVVNVIYRNGALSRVMSSCGPSYDSSYDDSMFVGTGSCLIRFDAGDTIEPRHWRRGSPAYQVLVDPVNVFSGFLRRAIV